MSVKRNEQTQNKREFIGKAWVNIVEKDGPHKGKEYINVTLDNSVDEVTISKGARLLLWPNDKRTGVNENTGKDYQDADYRVSLSEPVEATA